jgi:RimJ/RimL family protein N-acetyltransferase
MFGRNQGNVNLTVTYLNDRPIAGLWGLVSKNRVHLCLIMHSPILAEHSIGKLHIMKLSESLLSDHIDTLDLTPGSDPWKERFANSHDEVAEAIIYRSVFAKIKGELIYKFLNWVRLMANRAGITTAKLKSILAVIRSLSLTKLWQWIKKDQPFLIYQVDRSFNVDLHRHKKIRCNELNDLLLFQENGTSHSETGFLSSALARLEQGEKVYTMTHGNRLVYYCWMDIAPSDKKPIALPPDSIALHDFFFDLDFKKTGFFRDSMEHLLNEAFADPKIQSAYIFVPADNQSFCQILEAMGFVNKGAFIKALRFGNEKIRGLKIQ